MESRDKPSHALVYNVLYTDEYEFPVAEYSVTDTRVVLKNLQPMSLYYVRFSNNFT